MKAVVKRAIKDEKGVALPLALVLLVVGGLILTPLLGLMTTGLITGQVYEKKAHDYYAADAGVEDAIWKIKYEPPEWELIEDLPDSYVYEYPEPLIVDGRTVHVVMYAYDWDPTCGEDFTYQILSTVITDGGDTAAVVNSTAIDAHLSVSYLDLSSMLDYAIISNSTIDIQPNNYIDGDVWLPDEQDLDAKEGAINGTIYDSVNDQVSVTWPSAEDLSTYYLRYVGDAPDPGSSYDILGQTKTEGPWYRRGSLQIDNGGKDPGTLILQGTVYVTEDLDFLQSGSDNYTLDLNGKTIFAKGEITFPSARVTVSGSGCIIAIGDIQFQPSVSSNPEDFVLLMSVNGTVTMNPNGSFTGCVAGEDVVRLQPAQGEPFTVQWIDPEGQELDFPMGVGDINELPPVTGTRIQSWEID